MLTSSSRRSVAIFDSNEAKSATISVKDGKYSYNSEFVDSISRKTGTDAEPNYYVDMPCR